MVPGIATGNPRQGDFGQGAPVLVTATPRSGVPGRKTLASGPGGPEPYECVVDRGLRMTTIAPFYARGTMNLRKVLSNETIKLRLESTEKSEVIEELIDLLLAAGQIHDRKAALKAIAEREKKMSTGMQKGIAIPHGKSDSVDSLVAAIGIKKEGIDFKSLDGEPSRIFVMTLSPVNRTGPHIQFLAEISRLLNDDAAREQLLQAESEEEVLRVIAG